MVLHNAMPRCALGGRGRFVRSASRHMLFPAGSVTCLGNGMGARIEKMKRNSIVTFVLQNTLIDYLKRNSFC